MEKFKKIVLSIIEYVMPVASVFLTVFDMASDLALALEYKNNFENLFYTLTLTFLLVPGIVLGLLLLFFCGMTIAAPLDAIVKAETGYCKAFSLTFFTTVISCFNWEYWPHWKYFACMTESGPQLILQLYILTASENLPGYTPMHHESYHKSVQDNINMTIPNIISKQERGESGVSIVLQIISILSSLLSISWGAVKMKRSQDEEEALFDITTLDIVLDMIWNLLCMSCRVIVLALFASRFILEFWLLIYGGMELTH